MCTSKKLRFTLIFVVFILVLSVGVGVALATDYTKELDVAPFIENDRTYDTTRAVAEAFGIYVEWFDETSTVALTRGAYQVVMQVGSSRMVVTDPEGTRELTLDAAPVLKDGRVFLPVRLWAEHFGLEVDWISQTGGVTISEGAKTLSVMPGSTLISLSGGYFLKAYADNGVRFFYPEVGILSSAWSGHAEAIIPIAGKEYVISAIHAGVSGSDHVSYTEDQMTEYVTRNSELNDTDVVVLKDYYYGSPAFRISGVVSGIPQAGLMFLKNNYICGLTVEYKWEPVPSDESWVDAAIIIGAELDESELHKPEQVQIPVIAEADLEVYLDTVNTLLDEIIWSFVPLS